MKTRNAFLIIGVVSCARGLDNGDPAKNLCANSTDCQPANECSSQACINGLCQTVWKDSDGDGYVDAMCGAQFNDCNDTDAEIKPGINETCDCKDNDCDQTIDNGCNYQMKVLDKSTEVFGCFAAKSFRAIDTPLNDQSKNSKPRHNTVFINVLTEGWGSASVWYYGRDGKRYLFPSESVFASWFGQGADKCCLVRTVTNDVFNSIPTAFVIDGSGDISGGKVCYRPDAKIWKVDFGNMDYDNLYVVAHNCVLRQLMLETVAEEIFGPSWKNLIEVMPYAIFKDYLNGSPITGKTDFDPLFEQYRSLTIDNNQDL